MTPDTPAAVLPSPRLPERYRSLGLITEAEFQEGERLRKARYFLVHNDGSSGERLRCGRCNRLHDFLTWMCVPQPFCGLEDALYAYTKVSRDPEEKETVLERVVASLHEAANGHPQSAREWLNGDRVAVLGTALGKVEPIAPESAQRFERLIRARDASYRLVTLE